MELFDLIRVSFEDPKTYSTLSKMDKARHFFMFNRIMSISYPEQANILNLLKVSKSHVMDYWQKNMSKIYTKVPKWVFARGSKKSGGAKSTKLKLPSKPAINMYLQRNRMSIKELEEAHGIFGDAVYDPIHKLDKLMNK